MVSSYTFISNSRVKDVASFNISIAYLSSPDFGKQPVSILPHPSPFTVATNEFDEVEANEISLFNKGYILRGSSFHEGLVLTPGVKPVLFATPSFF